MNRLNPSEKLTARTDNDGRVRFRLPPGGMWLVKAVHMVPAPAGANADWASFWASLTFELQASATSKRKSAMPCDARGSPIGRRAGCVALRVVAALRRCRSRARDRHDARVGRSFSEDRTYDDRDRDRCRRARREARGLGRRGRHLPTPARLVSRRLLARFDETFRQRVKIAFDGVGSSSGDRVCRRAGSRRRVAGRSRPSD